MPTPRTPLGSPAGFRYCPKQWIADHFRISASERIYSVVFD